jgi:S-adenosylmethionine synthetase
MFEKVNPSHPDKLADRIAGAIVDLAYRAQESPRIAVEVLLGHGKCHIIAETSVVLGDDEVRVVVERVCGTRAIDVDFVQVPQDPHLADNQRGKVRCGDNGIFCGMPVTVEQKTLSEIAREIYAQYPTDGKYVFNLRDNGIDHDLIICQSNANEEELRKTYPEAVINPLGSWTGGPDVDTGATNRKLGSDMGDAVTGGGLHGKDLSKADVSVNIFAHLQAQSTGRPVKMFCAIGDEKIGGIPYGTIVKIASNYIKRIGGFEKFAEWGLI